ncbi:GIY-YIG nuclease family protein [Desulfobacter sp. UBA2225]|uniref:GIY-YIG nuclease family protein n=1 Tax=Desulfobacter sp. UBA2225 TaxID=1961413 RepID=UPI00257AC782|nr:GIY-YIG nuclease family protein [Desulfobacter sp. UBA2225]
MPEYELGEEKFMHQPIFINDLLHFDNFDNLKIRFVKSYKNDDPIEKFNHNPETLLNWQFWNYNKKKSFKEGEIAIGFVRVDDDKWLLFDISRVTKDLNIFNGVGYEYETLDKYAQFFGRVIIRYKNRGQNLIRKAESVIHECKVAQILEDRYQDNIFPGYENINISWLKLSKIIHYSDWKVALENQKGIYLISDTSNGKMYVGSAYGENMIHGRWTSYINNGHGGNIDLKNLDFSHIKENFNYSILEIFKSTVDDNVIIRRESWWKSVLLSKEYGYNKN